MLHFTFCVTKKFYNLTFILNYSVHIFKFFVSSKQLKNKLNKKNVRFLIPDNFSKKLIFFSYS